MKNIYLIGMPGCGKSTIGRLVAKNLKMEFIDLDEYIVSRKGRSIEDMFKEGEPVFRKAETECLTELSKTDNTIVATGGGVVVTEGNGEIMKESGTVIFVDSAVDTILKNSSLDGRPLLKDKNKIHTLYQNRISLYRACADYTLDNNGKMENTIRDIESIIKCKLKYV